MAKSKTKLHGATEVALSGKPIERVAKNVEESEVQSKEVEGPKGDKSSVTRNMQKKLRKKEKKKKESAEKAQQERIMQVTAALEMPQDELSEVRHDILKEMRDRFQQIPHLNSFPDDQVEQKRAEVNGMLATLEKEIHTNIVQQLKEVHKPEQKNLSAADILSQIEKIKHDLGDQSPGPNDPPMLYFEHQLRLIVSWENCKAFKEEMTKLRTETTHQISVNNVSLERVKKKLQQQRLLERIQDLKQMRFPDADLKSLVPSEHEIQTTSLDLTAESIGNLFGTFQLARKLERFFGTVIERVYVGNRPRSITISGHQKDVVELLHFLRSSDLSGKHVFHLPDERTMRILIGRSGAGVRKIEEDHRCFIHVDGQRVYIFGPKEEVPKVQQLIVNSKSTDYDNNSFAELLLPAYLVRALDELAMHQYRELEAMHGVSIKILPLKKDGIRPITIRGKGASVQVVKTKLQEIVERFLPVKFRTTAQTVQRLIQYQRRNQDIVNGMNHRSAYRQITEDFLKLKQNSRCSFSVDPDSEEMLVMVGEAEDVTRIKERVEKLVLFASLTPSYIAIRLEQAQAFDIDNQSLVMAETGIKLSVGKPNNRGQVPIELLGTEEQKNNARQMIEDLMERDATVKVFAFQKNEPIQVLTKNKSQRLQEIEAAYGVHISLDRSTRTATIVGSQVSVEDTLRSFEKIDDECKQWQTKVIDIENSAIRLVIGKGGTTITHIRKISGVYRLEIRDSDSSITLSGTLEAVDLAEKMIREVIQNSTLNENFLANADSPKPETKKESPTKGMGRPQQRMEPVDDHANFPSLEASANLVRAVPVRRA